MRKEKISKALSLLLVLTMIIGCLPQTVIFAAGEGVTTFGFSSVKYYKAFEDSTVSSLSDGQIAEKLSEYFESDTYCRNWRFFNRSWSRSSSYGGYTGGNGLYYRDGSFGDWFALKVRGFSTGTYSISAITYPQRGCVWGLYVLDNSVYGSADASVISAAVTNLSSGVQKVGEVDLYGKVSTGKVDASDSTVSTVTSTGSWAISDFGTADFTGTAANEYILVFRAERDGVIDETAGDVAPSQGKSEKYISLFGLSFEKVEALKEITASDISAVVGDEINPTENLLWIGTSGVAISAGTIEKVEVIENSDKAVLEDIGKFYAVAPGEATIKVTGSLASGMGGSKSTEIKVTVAENTRTFSGEVIDFVLTPKQMIANEAAGVDFEYANDAKTAILAQSVDDYFQSSDGAYVRDWKYFASTLSSSPNAWMTENSGTYFDGGSYGNWLAYKIKGVPAGTYSIKMQRPANYKGCVWGVYVLDGATYGTKTNDEITAALDAMSSGVQKLSEIDIYGNTASVVDFGKADFNGGEAAEHIILFRAIKDGVLDEGDIQPTNSSGVTLKSHRFIAMKGLSLDGTYIASVDTVLGVTELGVDESISIVGTSGKMSTGAMLDDMVKLGYVNYSVVEGNDVIELDGKTLTSKKAGTAVIETTVIAEGLVLRDRDTVVVDSKYNVDSISVSGNTTAYMGRAFRLVPLVKMGDGSESVPAGAVVSYEIVSGSEYVTVSGDSLIAGNQAGKAEVRAKLDYRGKTKTSEEFTVTVTEELETLSGETFTADLSALTFTGEEGELRSAVITVPEKGRYQLTLNADITKDAGIAELYAIPYSEAAMQNVKGFCFGAYKLGDVDLYGSADTRDTELPDAVFDDAGDYILAVCITGKNDESTGMNLALNSLVFDGESVIDKAETELFIPRLGADEESGFAVRAYLSNGKEIPIEDARLTYEYDESLLAVDAENMTVKTAADAEDGVSKLRVCVTYKDYSCEAEMNVDISNAYGINKSKKALLYSDAAVSVGNVLSFIPAVELNNQSVIKATGAVLTYEIVDNSDGAIAEEDGLLRAVKEGTVEIKAMFEFRGNMLETETVLISVTADINTNPNIEMNFTKEGTPGETLQYLTDATSYTANRRWKLHSVEGKDNSLQLNSTYGQFLFAPASENKYIALLINVPNAGKYKITTQSNYMRYRAGKIDMHIFPSRGVTDVAAAIESNASIGSADYYMASSGSVGEPMVIAENYEFTSGGEYFVILNLVPGLSAARGNGTISAEKGDCIYPTYIKFEEVNAMASAELKLDKETLDIGEETDIELALSTIENLPIEYDESLLKITYRSGDASIATVTPDGKVTAVSEGDTEIRAVISYGGVTKSASVPITVKDASDLLGIEMKLGTDSVYVYGSTDIALYATMSSGNIIRIPEKYITWTLSNNPVAEIENGYITGKAVGETEINAVVSDEFKTGAASVKISSVSLRVEWDATIDPAMYTLEERENAQRNIERYSWARSQAETATDNADKYLADFDAVYAMLSPEGIPRCRLARHTYDPNVYFCGYCGYDIATNFSIYGWKADPISRPWKIQCPDCKRVFPSNDFASFYELGLSESGIYWNYLDALQKHHEMFVCEDAKAGNECSHTAPAESAPEPGSTQWMANDPRDNVWYEYYGYGIEGGYLTNDIYSEMDNGWGVDDGFGYRQKFVATPGEIGYHKLYYNDGKGYARYADGTHDGAVQHTYIAYYLHEAVWFGGGGSKSAYVVRKALTAFRDAFLYTGDAKYGRAGAIMLDRIADIYPGFDWYQWSTFRGDKYRGKITDPAWSHHMDELFASSYDAFLPVYNDREVIETLSKRPLYKTDENGYYVLDEAGERILVNAKENPGALRKNVEDRILMETFKSAKEWEVAGNFGSTKKAVAYAAIALNKMPETGEMIDWLMQTDEEFYNEGPHKGTDRKGGNVAKRLIDIVDYDGHGNENASHYNGTWITNLSGAAEVLAGYKKYPEIDLYKNPKFMKMFTAQMRTMLGGYYGAQIGDTGYTASQYQYMDFSAALSAFNITGDREIAQALYLYNKLYNGGEKETLRGTIFDEDPEGIADRIEAIVEEYGEFDLSGTMMAGFGFAALRAGEKFESASASTESNTARDFAMYFGPATVHGHLGALNLYMDSFGLNFAPDLGYPKQTGNEPNRFQWIRTTLSHNTVVVDEEQQEMACKGTPYHFDSEEKVKVMDVSSNAYSGLDDYRRSVIMVDANDEVAYGVDFFHVKGGTDHLYSFHSQSDELSAISGLGEVESYPTYENENGELIGTYAGPDVMYGNDPGGNAPDNVYPLGYTWLKNVRKYNAPEKDFSVEFKVKDWRKILSQKKDLRLRLTMVSDEPMKEVSFVTGEAPARSDNKQIGELEYLLVRNKGNDLETTFTTVFEPYEAGNKYINSIEKLSMVRDTSARPGLNDSFGAVKVTLENGREDYVIYSTNTDVLYTVTDGETEISFRGFAGVLTVSDGEVAYRYLNDGDILELADEPIEDTVPAAYTGTVESFTTDYVFDNFITYTPASGETVDTDLIRGKYVYIENDGVKNSVYEILDAAPEGDNIKLSLGNTTLIRSYVDAYDPEAGYVYNIENGQSLRIPLSETVDSSPVVDPIADTTVSAGSSISIPFTASVSEGKAMSVSGTFPRGMSVNADNMTLTWKPDSSQIGENHVALTVSDGTLETTVHFTVTVYGSTTGSSSGTQSGESGASGESTGSADGGGGGGGAAPDTGDTSDNTDVPDDGGTTSSDETENDAGTDKPKFTDLTNYVWAADAINELASDGIIKGTTATTYSPANSITRADFALLLVRAFKLESDNTENFADVSAGDYFASELAVARNTGIVQGIGENKYAPRNTITRQDMMVITYRALQTLSVAVGDSSPEGEPSGGAEVQSIAENYADWETVASYAREAVAALIGAGIVNGKNGEIAPTDYTTRAEVAVLIRRVLDYVK